MTATPWLLYGAYGYTGRLAARRAVELGLRPVLAGRDDRRTRRQIEIIKQTLKDAGI